MSADEDEVTRVNRRIYRREQRACDFCRRRRRACDGVRIPLKECSSCVEAGNRCKFTGLVAKRGKQVKSAAPLQVAERLVEKAVGAPPAAHSHDSQPLQRKRPPEENRITNGSGPGVELAALSIRSTNTPAPVVSAEELAYLALADNIQALSLTQERQHFFGQSSCASFAQQAAEVRKTYEGKAMPWKSRRTRYWTFDPGRVKVPHSGPFIFPPRDLLTALVELYFLHKNINYPILHRPTFEQSLAQELHKRDRSFGAIVLLVCGIGARYSNDNRVCPPGMDPLECGYQFFHQVPLTIPHLFERATLYHIQFYCLAASFFEFATTAASWKAWALVGIGIRIAQDRGVHRGRPERSQPTIESELWKRAFWALMCMDRQLGASLGRSTMLRYEDFDAELPIECDDEYMEDGQPFVQPAGKPSLIAHFNCYIRLNLILGFALQMLYSLSKARKVLSYGDAEWQERIVAELDSALNSWVEALPSHLRWDPKRPDGVFFDQSAMLNAAYYYVRILIHRPFIPTTRAGSTPSPLPSLAICTNAARSCAHIIDTLRQRKNGIPVPSVSMVTFSTALVLILNIWNGKRTGLPPHMNTAIAQVHQCMDMLKVIELRWQGAGLLWDMLFELSSIGELPLPQRSPPSRIADNSPPSNLRKRRHGSGSDTSPHSDTAKTKSYFPHIMTVPSQTTLGVGLGPLMPARTAELGTPSASDQIPSYSSSWYPSQTSEAPLGFPDFAISHAGTFANNLAVDANAHLLASGAGVSSMAAPVSTDDMAMWLDAPMGYEIDNWLAYFEAMNEVYPTELNQRQ